MLVLAFEKLDNIVLVTVPEDMEVILEDAPEGIQSRDYFLKLKIRISSSKNVNFEEEMIERDSNHRTNS